MSDHHADRSPGQARTTAAVVSSVAADIQIAAASELPVLISADPVASRAIALELDRAGRARRGAVEIVDCRQPGALTAHPFRSRRNRALVLLLQEVHALSRDEQILLERQLDEVLQLPPANRIRVVASSSASLFDRVVQQRFRARLYYRLNMIHIMAPSSPGARRSRIPRAS